jgi:hypothetical protein
MLLFTATLAMLALILLVFRPAWGVLLIFIARPFVDTTWDTQVFAGLKLTEIFSGAVPLILLAHLCLPGSREQSLSRMPLRGVWIAWSLYVAIFSSFILYSEDVSSGFNILFRHLNGFIGFYMVQAYFSQGDRPKYFLWALAIAGLFPMAQGLIENVTGVHWKVTLGEGNLIRNIGMYHDAITIRYYALQTILALLLLSALYMKRRLLLQLLAMGYGLVCALVVHGAYSKSGTLTLGSWVLLWPLLLRRFKALAVMGVLGAGVAIAYAPVLVKSFETIFAKEINVLEGDGGMDRTFSGRWYTWQEMMLQWQEFGTFAKLFGAGQVATGAHNDYIQVLYHGGMVGLGLYILLLVTLLARVGRDLWHKADPWSVAALLVMIMWLIDTIGLVPSAYSGYQWFAWGVVGLAMRRRQDALRAERAAPLAAVAGQRQPVNVLQGS